MQSRRNFFRAVPAIIAAEMVVIQARPLWNTPFLPMQVVATSCAGAIGLAPVFNRAPGDRDVTLDNSLHRHLVLPLALVLVLGRGWLFVGMSRISAAHNAAFNQEAVSYRCAWVAPSFLGSACAHREKESPGGARGRS